MITVAYLTSRVDPKMEWFIDSLCKQEHNVPYNVVIVDFQLQYDPTRKDWVRDYINGRFNYTHVSPKPTAWQGVHRKTKQNWWAASNARNTAIALCSGDFLVCVDDLSVMKPGFLLQAEHARANNYLVMGMYEKVDNLLVKDGEIVSFVAAPNSQDSRLGHSSPTGIIPYPATSLYGCSFGLPLEAALSVNGFDEQCDSVSMEDCAFGSRIERTGLRSNLNRNMWTYEDRLAHGMGPVMLRTARKVVGFNAPPDGKDEADWYIMQNIVRNHSQVQSLGNDFNLRELRNDVLQGKPFPLPTLTHDWATGLPLGEL